MPVAPSLRIAPDLALPLEAVTEPIGMFANRGKGKALALSTPIPTPTGWTTMGDLQLGDEVFGNDGRPTRVVGLWDVQIGRPCFEVVFSDGASIVADEDHLWVTDTLLSRMADSNGRRYEQRGRGGRPQCERWRHAEIRTTAAIASTLRYGKRGDLNHSITLAGALEAPTRDLPIDPYVLGAWLGDGTSADGSITCADREIIDRIEVAGYDVRARHTQGQATNYAMRCPDSRPLRTALRDLGLLGHKHVPPVYLRASREQRLALLAGMLDTDGWVQTGEAMIGFKLEVLADAVHELVVSLGWQARRSKKPVSLNGIDCGVSHQVRFRPDVQVFGLERKRLPLRQAQARRHSRRMVADVRPIPSVPVRCITVAADNGLFLAGRDMVPTHNSNGAHRFVEQLYFAQLPSIVLDIKGDWYGIRSSADGTKAGLPFLILGGSHGDIGLEPGSGQQWARFLAEQRVPTIVDLSHFSKTQARRWVMEFAEELYRVNTEPLMLVVDEADVLIPQRLAAELMRLLGAMEDIAKRGRQRGLGLLVISQRVADVNKSVTDLLETLLLFAITGTRTRKAVLEWIDDHADPEEAKAVVATLSSMEPGECWVWSPGWLRILRRVRLLRPETFDSHATPAPGQRRSSIKTMADIDLSAVKEAMAETIEKVRADDPKELRRRISQLEKQLQDRPVETAVETVTETIEIPVLDDKLAARIEKALEAASEPLSGLRSELYLIRSALEKKSGEHPRRSNPAALIKPAARPVQPKIDKVEVRAVRGTRLDADGSPSSLPGPQRKLLTVLANHGPRTIRQLGMQAGYVTTGGAFRNPLGALRSAGYVTPTKGEPISITDEGLAALGEYETLPTGPALLDHWMSGLNGPCRKILGVLVDAWPDAMSVTDLAAAAGYEPSGGAFRNPLGKLRTLELVTKGGDLRLTDDFGEAIS